MRLFFPIFLLKFWNSPVWKKLCFEYELAEGFCFVELYKKATFMRFNAVAEIILCIFIIWNPDNRWKCVLRDDLQFIFGIPTINRKNENYLYDTIDSLLNGLNNFETKREPCFKLTLFTCDLNWPQMTIFMWPQITFGGFLLKQVQKHNSEIHWYISIQWWPW